MKNATGIYLTVLFLFLLSSCSISMEKRRYRPGYHVEVVQHPSRNLSKPTETNNKDFKTYEITNVPDEKIESVTEFEPTSNTEHPISVPVKQLKKREKKKLDMDSCDVIFTAVGERIQARIVEITDEYVHYKRCDDPKGRLYSLKTKMIDNITLRNGDLFVPPNRVIVDKEHERKKSQTLFVLSIVSLAVAFVSFVFSFFISPFGTIGFIFAILSGIFSFILVLMDIRPGKYTPSYRTKLTWVFYLIVLALVIATMVLAFI
jgi:hypothetical protein